MAATRRRRGWSRRSGAASAWLSLLWMWFSWSLAGEHAGELAGLGLLDARRDAVQQPARSDVLGGHRLDQLALADGVDDGGRDVLGRDALRAVVLKSLLLAGRQAAAHDRRGADRRVDDPRAQRGDVDAARCELGVERLAHPDYAELRRAVRRHPRGGHQPEPRGGVDDVRAATLAQHARDEGRDAVGHAEQVDVDDPPPVVDRGVLDVARVPDARVVVQDVDGAVLVEDARGERLDGGRVGDVEPVRHGGTDVVRDALGALSVEVGTVDLRAELGEQARGGPADARAGAGDDGHRAVELLRAVVHRGAPLTCIRLSSRRLTWAGR